MKNLLFKTSSKLSHSFNNIQIMTFKKFFTHNRKENYNIFFLLLLVLLPLNSISAQTNWQKGFEEGFENGYCYNETGCVSPPATLEMMNIGDESQNYQDGYNKGFVKGKEKRAEDNNYNNKNSTSNDRFKTTETTFVKNAMYNPFENIGDAVKLAEALRNSKGRALEYLNNEEYQKVAEIGFAGLRINPQDDEFMLLLGQAYKGVGDKKNAIKWFEKSSRFRPNDKNLKTFIRNYKKGDFDEKQESVSTNNSSRKNLNKIKSLMQNSKYIEAILLIDKEIEKTGNPILFETRGYANYSIKNYRLAILDITKSANSTIEIKPRYLFIRALAKGEIGDYFGAINDYDLLITKAESEEIVVDLATIYNNKAYSYVKLKNYNKALPFVTKALELDSNTWYIWDTRAEIYLNTGNYQNAIDDATKALEMREHEHTYFTRGLALIKKNKKSLGCKDLSRAGELGLSEAYDKIEKHCQ